MNSKRLGEVRVTQAEQQKADNNELARQLSHSKEKKAISATVEEKQAGETMSFGEVSSFLGEQPPQSEIHPDHDEKPTAKKYREKFSDHWSDETREQAMELYQERGNGE